MKLQDCTAKNVHPRGVAERCNPLTAGPYSSHSSSPTEGRLFKKLPQLFPAMDISRLWISSHDSVDKSFRFHRMIDGGTLAEFRYALVLVTYTSQKIAVD